MLTHATSMLSHATTVPEILTFFYEFEALSNVFGPKIVLFRACWRGLDLASLMALRPNMHSANTLLAGLSALLGQTSEEAALNDVASDPGCQTTQHIVYHAPYIASQLQSTCHPIFIPAGAAEGPRHSQGPGHHGSTDSGRFRF